MADTMRCPDSSNPVLDEKREINPNGIKGSDLKDQTGMMGPHPFLYCDNCGQECSANAGDYWDRKDEVFECCGESMRLVRKIITLVDVDLETE